MGTVTVGAVAWNPSEHALRKGRGIGARGLHVGAPLLTVRTNDWFGRLAPWVSVTVIAEGVTSLPFRTPHS